MNSYELVCQKSEEIKGKGFEIKAECDCESEWGDFNSCWATLTFYKDGEVIEWEEEIFKKLVDSIDYSYLGEKHYKILNNQSVYIEINNYFNEDINEYTGISGIDESSKEMLDEHLEDVERMYKKQIGDKNDL